MTAELEKFTIATAKWIAFGGKPPKCPRNVSMQDMRERLDAYITEDGKPKLELRRILSRR